jgi:Glycosyl hydrolase family 10
MGSMSFLLPTKAPPAALADLHFASIAGGYDNMPAPTRVQIEAGELKLFRDIDESGALVVPWEVAGAGRVMGTTATLIERPDPYQFSVELARGKINQLRCQAADWRMVGLQIPDAVEAQVREASRLFGRAATAGGSAADADALAALSGGYKAGNQLVRMYVDQMLRARHQRQPRLETGLGVRLNGPVPPTVANDVAAACNSASVPLTWKLIEPTESQYHWDQTDAMLEWATKKNLRITAGPLVDFSAFGLPEWLWLWESDLPSLSSFMCDYVETVVGRYHKRIRRWQLTAGSNNANVLRLGEDDLLWLTARLAEAAWQVDSEIELIVGIAQPWGEYMARAEHTYSPFVFADTLIRAGLKLSALDLEWTMGVTPRGSYVRDLLDASRLLDLYALLGTPLQVTLAYPSELKKDALADPALSATGGYWLNGLTPDGQADWAADFLTLAVCKPFVRGVSWAHLSDAEIHQFPQCGLLDAAGQAKVALSELRHLRDEHLT